MKKADPAGIGLPEEGDDIKFRKLSQEQSKISVPIVIVARKPEKLRDFSKISKKSLQKTKAEPNKPGLVARASSP